VEAAVGAVSFDAKWVANRETAGAREYVCAPLAQSIAAPWLWYWAGVLVVARVATLGEDVVFTIWTAVVEIVSEAAHAPS
jgi:hypothetical protein